MTNIAADMRRAFDGRQQFALAYVDENYMTLPIFDRTVLSQIHNTTMIYDAAGHGASLKDMDITQNVDKNILTFHPYLTVDPEDPADLTLLCNSASTGTRIFNFFWDGVTEDDIIEGTRNAPVLKLNDEKNKLYLHQCGADICVGITVHVMNAKDSTLLDSVTLASVFNEKDSSTSALVAIWSSLSVFDWAPIVYGLNSDLEVDAAPLAELCNYTTISAELLSRIHENVAMSMWSIPEFGGFDG